MQVKDMMTRGVESIRPNASLWEAAERMKTLNVGALPVCDGDRLVGVLTDRDITVRSVAAGHDPLLDPVQAAMTPEPFCCFDDQDVADAAELMSQRQVRRLPVLNREEALVGIVTLGDLAVETGSEELAGRVLESISTPAFPRR
jgi:CBS domain-containing protein